MKIGVLMLCLSIVVLALKNKHNYERLNGPVVGILSLPTSKKDLTFSEASFSMIPGSYVKWLEQAGIRIIPIRYDMPRRVIDKLMSSINGILITGGSTRLFRNNSKLCKFKKLLSKKVICPSRYMSTVNYITKMAKKMFNMGNPFPIWGTCLGYEALMLSLSKFTLKRQRVSSVNHSLNLNLNDQSKSFFKKYFDPQLITAINDKPLIYFNHKFAFKPRQIRENKVIGSKIDILSTTKLENNEVIVSMVKDKTYPFIGVQFHPEKIQFEHRSSVTTNVSFWSIEASHKLAMVFFDHVNKNQNEMEKEHELEALLIYNYPIYKSSGPYEQVYVFPRVFELNLENEKRKIVV
jgi:gamma-glutamyl hydrolase